MQSPFQRKRDYIKMKPIQETSHSNLSAHELPLIEYSLIPNLGLLIRTRQEGSSIKIAQRAALGPELHGDGVTYALALQLAADLRAGRPVLQHLACRSMAKRTPGSA